MNKTRFKPICKFSGAFKPVNSTFRKTLFYLLKLMVITPSLFDIPCSTKVDAKATKKYKINTRNRREFIYAIQ